MFERRKYISAALSVFYPTFAGVNVNTDRIAEIVRGRYFSPSVVMEPAGSQVISMLSEHGHSQIIVGQDSTTLMVTFSADWEQHGVKGLEYVHERAGFLLPILEQVSPRPRFLYAGSGFTIRLQTADGQDGASVMAHILRGEEQATSQDVGVRTTRQVDDAYYLNSSIGTYRQWANNMFSAPYTRLPLGLAMEEGIEISEDFNSRLAFHESRDVPVDDKLLHHLIDESFRAVEQHASNVERGERLTI